VSTALGHIAKPAESMGGRQASVPDAVPLWQRLRTWWLLLPLFYFATDGQMVSMNREQISTSGLSATQVAIGLLFWVIAVLHIASSFRATVKAAITNWEITLFTVYAIISASWSPDPLDSLRKVVFLTILVLFSYFLLEKYSPEEQMRLIFATGCLAIIASYLVVAFVPGRGIEPGAGSQWNGIFGHKNNLGIYTALYVLPFFFLRSRMSLLKIANWGWVVLALIAIYKSEARTGWVVCLFLAGYLMVASLLKRLKPKDALAGFFVVISLVGLVVWVIFANLSFFTSIMGKDTTLTGRTDIWMLSLWALKKHMLFGYGYAGFWGGMTSESNAVIVQIASIISGQEHTYHAHNAILNLALQLGIIGTAILVFAIIMAFRNAFIAFFRYRSSAALWYAGTLLAMCIAGSDESLFMNYLSLMTVLLVLSCAGLRKLARGEIVPVEQS